MVDDYGNFIKEVSKELYEKLDFSMLVSYTQNKKINIKIFKQDTIIINKNYINIFEALNNIIYTYNLKKAKQKVLNSSINYKHIFSGKHIEEKYNNKDITDAAEQIIEKMNELGKYTSSTAQIMEVFLTKLKLKNHKTHRELKLIKEETSVLLGKEIEKTSISTEYISLEKYRALIREVLDDLY